MASAGLEYSNLGARFLEREFDREWAAPEGDATVRDREIVAALIRGKAADKALTDLAFSKRRVARDVRKVLESAIANAEHNHGADIDELKVATIEVNEAPTFRRYRARAKGRGARIIKRNSHITIRVADE